MCHLLLIVRGGVGKVGDNCGQNASGQEKSICTRIYPERRYKGSTPLSQYTKLVPLMTILDHQ